MGIVSPNGIGKPAFSQAVLEGKSGVKRISRWDPSSLPVHIAGEIPEFDELAWIDARERKHVSRVVPLAIAACAEAIKSGGLDPASMSMEEKREIGIVIGSGGGAQEFSEEQYRLWHSGHIKQVSLFCIPSGTMGTMSSEIQMRFGFRGYSHVVTTGCTSSTDAIGYAMQSWGVPYRDGGAVPYWGAILDDTGRVMVMITFNNDLGDSWQWAVLPALTPDTRRVRLHSASHRKSINTSPPTN